MKEPDLVKLDPPRVVQITPEQAKECHTACHDGLKLQFDLFKHLTTLSSASVLFLATFLDKLGEKVLWRPFVALSFFCFLVSTGMAIGAMFCIARTIRKNISVAQVEKEPSDNYGRILKFGFWVSSIAFCLAVLSLALFGTRNMWR